jgi:peptidyl-prolyl cis-trans isomerase A (cyclophilin A)
MSRAPFKKLIIANLPKIKKGKIFIGLFILMVFFASSCLNPQQKLVKKAGYKHGIFAKITTEKGVILAKLEFEKVPLLVANFIGLAEGSIPNTFKKDSIPYYDSLRFYKVYKGYMAMTGCPKNSGNGNPGYVFMDEFHEDLKHDTPGILSMQSDAPHNNGSQFVITMRPSSVLDGKNSVFGKVISGMDVVNGIQQGDMLLKIDIIRIGRKANKFNAMQVFKDNGFERMIK